MAQYRPKDGDTVDHIAYKYYGSTDNRIVELMLDANPRLSDQPAVLGEGVLLELPKQSQAANISNKKVKLWD